MDRATYKYIEKNLFAYPDMDKRITQVRNEVMNPWNPEDENIGGGQSNLPGSPTERQASLLLKDKRLQKLEEMKQAIAKVYDNANVIDRKLMELYFFTRPRKLTMDGVADNICVSRATAYRSKKYIIKKVSEELGIE